MKLQIEIGSKYGKLTVIKEAPPYRLPSGQSNRAMECKCECGNTTTVRVSHLTRLKTTSCGCNMPAHGDVGTKLHTTWRGMLNRVKSPNYIDAHRYHERGIDVCDDWLKYPKFKEWALANGYVDGLQIDRRDNDKGYHPSNCRFVTNTV